MHEALIKDSLIRLSTATQLGKGGTAAGGQPSENRDAGQCENADTQAAIIAREIDTLDTLLAKERRSLHPQLVHFLAHRSYAKALAFLGGETDGIPASARRKINEKNA